MYWIHPTSQKQIWQRLPAGDEGEDPRAGGAPQHGGPQAFPPGCQAGTVKLLFGFDLIPNVGFPLSGILLCSQLKENLTEKLLDRYLMENKAEKIKLV